MVYIRYESPIQTPNHCQWSCMGASFGCLSSFQIFRSFLATRLLCDLSLIFLFFSQYEVSQCPLSRYVS